MELDADSLLDTIRLRQRDISIAAIVIVALGGGIYLWRGSVTAKNERAQQAFNSAAGSYYSGNKALAASDLAKMTDRYAGTPAGVQGAMLLAQVLFEDGKWDDGIKKLEAAKGSSAAERFAPSIEGLVGGGYADWKKYDDAAKHFLAAAEKAPFPGDKDLYRAEAARALTLAGKTEEARKIWLDIASRLDSPALGEAKIRLGELEAAPAAKP